MTVTLDPVGTLLSAWFLLLIALHIGGLLQLYLGAKDHVRVQAALHQIENCILANNWDRAVKLSNAMEHPVAPVVQLVLKRWAFPQSEDVQAFKVDALVHMVDAHVRMVRIPIYLMALSLVTALVTAAAIWAWYPSTVVLVLGVLSSLLSRLVAGVSLHHQVLSREKVRALVLELYVKAASAKQNRGVL